MLHFRFRTVSAATIFCLLTTTASFSITVGGDQNTLATVDQNMFGDITGPIGFQPDDLTIVDTGILPQRTVGTIKQVRNTLALEAYNALKTTYDGLVTVRNVAISGCNLILLPSLKSDCLATVPAAPTAPTVPPATVKDGTELTISNVGISFGLGSEFNLGEGKVSAAQEFQSEFTVDKGNFQKGDELTIGTSVTLGSASLSSELGGIEGKIEQIVSVSAKVKLENYILGLRTVNQTIYDEDLNDERTTIAGFEIDDQSATVTALGIDVPLNVKNGLSLNFGPTVGLATLPAGDITLFAPDLDVENATGQSSIGQQVTVPPGVFSSLKADENRTGDGILPEDFAKLDLDVDVVTASAGLPLGAEIADIEFNLFDLDAGAFFSLGQDQSFATEEILVTLTFSTPTEVETAAGSGIFETVSTKTVILGSEIKIKHPGGDLQVTPEYSMGKNTYFNRTQMTLTPAITMALGQVQIGGIFGTLIPENNFAIYEDTFEPTDTYELGDLFNASFGLMDFNTRAGTAFSLNAMVPKTAAVSLPMSLPLLAGALGLMGVLRRRT